MSERKKKCRGLRSLAAVVSAVALGIGGVAVPGGGLVPSATAQSGETGQNWDSVDAPTWNFAVEITPDNDEPTGDFNYRLTFDARPPQTPASDTPGSSNLQNFYAFIRSEDGKTEISQPSAENFNWASGTTHAVTEATQVDGGWIVRFGNEIPNGDYPISAEIPARVVPGQTGPFEAFADAGAELSPKVGWEKIDGKLESLPSNDLHFHYTDNGCVGEQHSTLKLNGGGYGEQLVQLFLGTDDSDFYWAQGSPNPNRLEEWKQKGFIFGDGYSLRITDPDGNAITQEVFEKRLDDVGAPRKPYQFPDGTAPRWLNAFEWPAKDPANVVESDEVWLRDGTTIEYHQLVGDNQCRFTAGKPFGHVHTHLVTGRGPVSAYDDASVTFAEVEPTTVTTESVTATTTVATTSVTARVTPTTVTTTPTTIPTTVTTTPTVGATTTVTTTPVATASTTTFTPVKTAPATTTTPVEIAGTTTTTPTSTAPTFVTTPTSTAPTFVTTPTSTAGTVTTTVGTKSVTATTTPTTVTTTPTETASTVTVTPTSTEDCGCEPTTTTKTEKVPVPVPTTVHTTTTAEAPKRGTIGDRVWEDTNGDGVEDPGEKTGIPNVLVVIVDKDGNEVTRTVTDKDGNWKVDVEPGEYTVRYEPGDRTPSDKEQVERTIVIEPGEENFDVDLGILPSGSVGDRVWNDANGDGKQGEDEQGLENVVVLVSREGEPTRSAVTDENGDWKIEGLNPDAEYEVRFIKPEGWEATGKVPGSDESGLISKVTVKPNEYNDSYDLGLKKIDPDCGCEPEEPGTIGDRVWVDENGDGKEDPNEKTGVPGVTVIVKDPEGEEVTRTVTDENGNWKVEVKPGDYTVEYKPGENTPSQPDQVKRTVTIEPGEENFDVDLGILPSGSVGDRVWNDEDGDGKQGEDEKGLENVVVLVSREGEPTRSAVTDENGDWKIEGLNPDAEYEVRFIKPEGWEVTGKVPGSDESGLVSKVTVKPNEYNDSYDLGLQKVDPGCDCEPVKPGTIGNRVWIDLNGNGKQDPNETEGVPDVTVIVRAADGNEVTRTVTDEDGNWKVNVEPGDYEIEYRPRDWKPTDPKRVTQKVTVEEGKEYLDLDLGVQKPKPGEPTPPTEEPQPEKGSSTETLDRCVANAVRSPLLYLVPVALLGAFGGEIARPYMGAINEQVNQINAQFQEAMRRNSPDWGHGGRGGRDNDQFAELRGQIDAANRRIAELGQDPNVQRFGTVAAGIIGLIAAGGVLYDWCSNEKGEAFTAVGGSSSKDAA